MWDQWRDYDPSAWEETLERELSAFPPLRPICSELKAVWAERDKTPGVPLDELLRGIRAQTLPFYELLWTSCTRDEKLVLIQLAQEGFITAQCWDVAATLVAKGLIVNEPFFAIFNRTFRDFLIDTETELRKVTWPSRREEINNSIVVVVTVVIIGVFILSWDLILSFVQKFVYDQEHLMR